MLKKSKIIENHFKAGRLYRDEGKIDLSVGEFEKVFEFIEEDIYLKNKVLNEIEISQRKTVLESKPRGLLIPLTTRCNIRCKMCEVWRNNKDIPEERVKEIINYLPYLEFVIWQGGEPFLSDYFENLLEETYKYRHLRQQVITNGLFIDEKWAKKLAKEKLELVFSIDGIVKNTYESIRRGAKFDDLIECINLINLYKRKINKGLPLSTRMITTINLVVMKSNYPELVLFPGFAKRFEFDRLVLMPVEGISDEENIFLHNDPVTEEKLRGAILVLSQKAKEYNIKVLNWLPVDLSSQKKDKKITLVSKQRNMLCLWPWQFMMIDTEFKVRPHCLCEKRLGDVNESSLGDIWNGEAMQMYRKKIIDNDYEDLCDHRCTSGIIRAKDLRFN